MFLTDIIVLYRYGYDWKREEADKNLLRTHTTAVSTRMLYMLAQQVLILTISEISNFQLFMPLIDNIFSFKYMIVSLFVPNMQYIK